MIQDNQYKQLFLCIMQINLNKVKGTDLHDNIIKNIQI